MAARRRLGGPTLLVAVALAAAACSPAVVPAPTAGAPSPGLPSPAGPSGAGPSAAAPSTGIALPPSASGVTVSPPDDSPGALPSSSTLPSFVPPPTPSLAPGAATLALHVPVLMYHRVVPPALAGASLEALDVPPTRFAEQMAALAAAGWHTITAGQLADDLAAAVTPPPRTFVISFDDGYDDGYVYALPILQAHGFVATYFIVPGRVTEANWAAIALSPDHIRALADAGMEIANHTYSHIDLAGRPAAIVQHQVVAASERIERIVGSAPTTFAYPFGSWDQASAEEVAAAGMILAFTTVEGARETWATRLESPRIRVGPATTPAELVAQLARYQ